MSVTMRDVARLAEVSSMTVSRVLSGAPHVAADTRRRVEAAVAQLGYVPNGLARGLSRRRTGTIGLVVPDIGNPFFMLVVRGAEEAARRTGNHVILCNTQGDLDRERRHLEDLLAFRVDGVVIAPVGDTSRPHLALLMRNGVPYTLVDRSVAGARGDLVRGDGVSGARLLVGYLIELGHRRIALVTGSDTVSTARERLVGYREALDDAGTPFDPDLVVEASAIERHAARGAASRVLDLRDPPTAIFAVNNMAAIGVAEAARDRHLAIPDDLGLVCFDDIELSAQLDPFLTVFAQPAETFGTVALQLLLDRIAGRTDLRDRTVVLPGELVVRRSAARPG
jgi:LacI family transcriptional regulator